MSGPAAPKNEAPEGVPTEEQGTPLGDMTMVVDLGSGGRWMEIVSQHDANRACILTRTVIHYFYGHEHMMEGGHPRRWFVLVGEGEEGPRGDVCLAVTPPGAELKDPGLLPMGVHVTGYQNRNAYPDFQDQIDALERETGLVIEPNYMGRPLAGSSPKGGM